MKSLVIVAVSVVSLFATESSSKKSSTFELKPIKVKTIVLDDSVYKNGEWVNK